MTKSKPTHDVVFKSGTFTGNDGKERHAYRTIGAAWPDENGTPNRIRIETVPVHWDGIIYLRPREVDESKDAS